MKCNNDNRKGILKRCGVVLLSSVLALSGTLAMQTGIPDTLRRDPEKYAYAEVAKKTEKSIESSFPKLKRTSGTSDKLTKDETVYVIMDADGNREETVVSAWLKNPEGLDQINDKTRLKDIENTSGEETFTQDGKNVVWDARGNDIKYTGKTDASLPVSCEVTYYLDGDEVSAEEIAGKKGEVEIHFNYFVNTQDRVTVDGKGYDVEHPYIMASGLMLDNEHFTDVEVTNGKCITEGGNTICVGIALPGLKDSLAISNKDLDIPESVVVKAVTNGFTIDGTYTAALTGLLGDLDISSGDITDKLDELESGLSQLSDASKKLVKGSKALKKGTGELSSGTTQLAEGSSQLAAGTSTLKKKSGALSKGVKQLYDGSKELSDGTSTIKSGTKKAVDGAKAISDGLSEISSNSESLNTATKTLETNIFENATTQLRAALKDAGLPDVVINRYTLTPSSYKKDIKGLKNLAPGRSEELDALEKTLDNLEEYVAGVKAYTDGVDTTSEGMETFYSEIQKLDEGAGKVNSGASEMKKGLSSLSDSIPALKKGIKKLDDGASQVSSGASELDGGAEQLDKGAGTLAKGIAKFDKDGIQKFVGALDEYDLGDMLSRVQAVKKASDVSHFVGGTPKKIAGESRIIFKTKEIKAEED